MSRFKPGPYKSGVAAQLITYMIVFSSLITVFMTGFQLFLDYQRDVNLIDDQLRDIPRVHFKTLKSALWRSDISTIQAQIEGILQIQDIEYVAVIEKGSVLVSVGREQLDNVVTKAYPIFYPYRGSDVEIGTFIVSASLEGIYKRLFDKAWVILISNAIKTFFVAGFMFLLYYRLNTRHLHHIAEYIQDIYKGKKGLLGEDLRLERDENKYNKDELDTVVTAINQMRHNINELLAESHHHREHLEETVEERSLELINALNVAESANNTKSDFLSSMSHELRTPLNAILGFAQMLKLDEDELSSIQQDNVNEILDAGSHLLALINDILDLSKIESGKLELSIERVSVEEIIEQCLSLMQPIAADKPVTIINNFNCTGCAVSADETRLKQVIINLLSNAVKYNVTNGLLRIDCNVKGRNILRISISDQGAGIQKQDIPKLFNSFERLNEDNNVEGTGIGLVISKHLMTLMKGEIGVISTIGEGSTFWIELPVIA